MKYAVVSVGADLSGNLTEDGDDYGADMDVRLSELGGARYACHETINVGTTKEEDQERQTWCSSYWSQFDSVVDDEEKDEKEEKGEEQKEKKILVLWGGELSESIADRIVSEGAAKSIAMEARPMEGYRKSALKALAASGTTLVMVLQTVENNAPPESAGGVLRFFKQKSQPVDRLVVV